MRLSLRLAVAFLFALSIFAQTDRGTITGTVSDPAGAVIASAPIEAKNVATGAVYQTASSATGNYTIAQLPAGTYEMSVTVTGFKKFIRTVWWWRWPERCASTRRWKSAPLPKASRSPKRWLLLKTEGGEVSQQRLHQHLERPSHPHVGRSGGRHRIGKQPGQYPQPAGRRSNCCPARVSQRIPSCASTGCRPTRNPSTLKARTPPTGSSNSRTRSTRRVWKRSRKWPSKPVISPPSMARRAAGTSTTP